LETVCWPLGLPMSVGTVSLVLHYFGLTRMIFFIKPFACEREFEEENLLFLLFIMLSSLIVMLYYLVILFFVAVLFFIVIIAIV
jgi:hypothetical protein